MFVLKFRDELYNINSGLKDFSQVLNSSQTDQKPSDTPRTIQKRRAQTEMNLYKMKQTEELDDQFKFNISEVSKNEIIEILICSNDDNQDSSLSSDSSTYS